MLVTNDYRSMPWHSFSMFPGVSKASIFGEKVDFHDRHKMDTDYDNMTTVELRILVRARRLRVYTEL